MLDSEIADDGYITEYWECEDCHEEFLKDGGFKDEIQETLGDWQNEGMPELSYCDLVENRNKD